jgi:hypothetical protein
MVGIGFSLTIAYDFNLTEEEYDEAEKCISILAEALDVFEKAVKERGLTLYETDMGYEIKGSVFQKEFAEYQETNYANCNGCGRNKRLSELVYRNILRVKKGEESGLLCDECR